MVNIDKKSKGGKRGKGCKDVEAASLERSVANSSDAGTFLPYYICKFLCGSVYWPGAVLVIKDPLTMASRRWLSRSTKNALMSVKQRRVWWL